MTERELTYGDGFAAGLEMGIRMAQGQSSALPYVAIDPPKQEGPESLLMDDRSASPQPETRYAEFAGPPQITVHGLWKMIGSRRMNDRWFARLVFEGHFSSAYQSADEPVGVVLMPMDGKP